MISSCSQIFNRRLLRQRLVKTDVKQNGLIDHITQTLLERLTYIKRSFNKVLLINPPPGFPLSQNVVTAGWSPTNDIICDDEFLPFAPHSFDLVISFLSLHHINDVPGALLQIRHILQPDGLLLAAFFGQDSLCELRDVLQEVDLERRCGVTPRVAPMIGVRDAGALLQRAGFTLPVCDHDRLTIDFDDLNHLMKTLKDYGQSNVQNHSENTFTSPDYFVQANGLYQKKYGHKKIPATVDVVYLSGWAPAPHQPKALKPGSAQYQLSDFL